MTIVELEQGRLEIDIKDDGDYTLTQIVEGAPPVTITLDYEATRMLCMVLLGMTKEGKPK